jgi:hypothetical protein
LRCSSGSGATPSSIIRTSCGYASSSRTSVLRLLLAALQSIVERTVRTSQRARAWLLAKLDAVNRLTVIFFTKGDNLANLNRAALYVLQNEQTKRLRVVHVYGHKEDVQADQLTHQLRTLDEVYPELRIDLVLVRGRFGPELIERLSRQLGVPKNYMFIGTPGDSFPHNIAELGGVRLII